MQKSDIQNITSALVSLVVEKKYDEAINMCYSSRLKSNDLRNSIKKYGRTLRYIPPDGLNLIQIVKVDRKDLDVYMVECPLWTIEEGRSDLSLEITLIGDLTDYRIELDSLHVL